MRVAHSNALRYAGYQHRRSLVSYVVWKDNVAKSSLPPIPAWVSQSSFTDFVFNKGSFLTVDPSKLAIVEGETKRTFGDLKRDVGVFRQFVEKDLKLKKGDVVTLISPNHADYFSLVHGVCSAGCSISPVNPVYTSHEIEFQIKRAKSKAVVTHTSCLEEARKAAQACGIKDVLVLDDEEQEVLDQTSPFFSLTKLRKQKRLEGFSSDPVFPILASGDDTATLPFSSGTTGLPKATILSHGNLCANLAQSDYGEARLFKADDAIMSALPMFHIYAFTVSLNLAMLHGKTLVTCKRFNLDKFCEAIAQYKCSRAHVVPPIILAMSKSPTVENHDLSSLRVLLSAAAPLGGETARDFMKRFPNVLCKQAWGMSELSPIGTMVPDDDNRSGSVGPPIASTEAKVVDLKTRKALPPNHDGELLMRGPQVMKGYLNEPEKTKESIDSEGWLSTGDIARIDDDGFVYIVDRLKELIKYKGFQVAPAELEALLLTHPAVLDAVVIPRPDKEGGEVPRAYCVLRPNSNVTGEDIVTWAAPLVAHFKKLRGGVIFVDQIPKTSSGKILRREVVAMDRANFPLN